MIRPYGGRLKSNIPIMPNVKEDSSYTVTTDRQLLTASNLIGGMNVSKDTGDIENESMVIAKNVRIRYDKISKRYGLSILGATKPDSNKILGTFGFKKYDASGTIIRFTKDGLYKNPTAWSAITGTLTGADTNRFQIASAFNQVVFTNGVDPIQVINAGLTTLLIPIKSLDSILKIHPDFEKLKNFCISNEIDIIEVFTTDVSDKFNDFRVRVFAPTFGYLEDPATGSGNSAFGYYLLSTGQFNKNTIVIEQNGDKNRFNIVKLQKQFDNEGIERIMFGGGAIKRIDGKYFLY